MIAKWALVCGIIGAFIGVITEGMGGLMIGGIIGAAIGIAIRKWIFRTFWQ